ALEGVDKGVVAAQVKAGSDAANVGLQRGDVVLAVNGAKISTTRDLKRAAAERESYWKLSIERKGQVLTSIVGG
ncbi:MAG TPA: PDZ domain-containing protein, partial [Beijerinckiaceae bacterium]|nr:PDZ domain-containing protein [Beijerinckiaceae bacterium]